MSEASVPIAAGETLSRNMIIKLRRSYVTCTLIAVNTTMFLLTANPFPFLISKAALDMFALNPAFVLKGDKLYTLITSMFLHGSFLHLLGNMLFLWIFGRDVEARLRTIRFLALYLGSGLFSCFVGLAAYSLPTLGASGAISGIMGSTLILFPKTRIKLIFIPRIKAMSVPKRISATYIVPVPKRFVAMVLWFIYQFLLAFIGSVGVGYWVHVGGFAFSILIIVEALIWRVEGK